MFETFCLGVALTVGQAPGRAAVGDDLPTRIPAPLPSVTLPSAPMPIPGRVPLIPTAQAKDPAPMTPMPIAPKNGDAKPEEPKAEDEKKEEEVGHFMRLISGTCVGSVLEECKIKVDGWAAFSYTHSSRDTSNLPVTWNDRANSFLMQQFWVNIEKPLDTDSKCVNYGFKVAFLAGSDYRFTVVRGLLDDQLKNSKFDIQEANLFKQNIYGFDIPIFYANAWLPGVMGEGTEVGIGRFLCPWGYESVMAPTAPLLSRSYAFQWAPPFFHTGLLVAPTFNKNVSAKMILGTNDTFLDGSDELRFIGAITFTDDEKNNSLTLGTTLGRGKFNAGRPNGPAQGTTTLGLAYEPAGRNNINVFDLVYTHKMSDDLSYAVELIYGYQQGVPAGAAGIRNPGDVGANFNGTSGTAHWGSIVNYLTYNFSETTSGIARFEIFHDAQGQRTGFEGCYYAGTLGLQFKPCSSVIFRPEVRYDYNDYSRPFQGNHGILTAAADLIFKF